MVMLRSLALGLSSVLAINTAAVLPRLPTSVNITDAYLALDDGSLSLDPDPRFSVSPSFHGGFLPPIPTLMNVLYVLAEIAYGDINSKVRQQSWSTAGYSQIEIVTTEALKGVNLLFGLFTGIEYMVKFNRFNEVLLTLSWEKITIGRIWMVLPGFDALPSDNGTNTDVEKPLDLLSSTTFDLTAIDTKSLSTNSMNNTISLGTNVQMSVEDIPGGLSLNRNEVFLACFATLVHLAPYSNDAYMEDFTTKTPLSHVYMHLLHWGPGVKNFRVIQAMTYVPRSMLSSGFREVRFRVIEEGVKVLEGSIRRIAPQNAISVS